MCWLPTSNRGPVRASPSSRRSRSSASRPCGDPAPRARRSSAAADAGVRVHEQRLRVALMFPCRRRNSSSVRTSCEPRWASYSAKRDTIDRRVLNAAVDGDSQEILVGAQVFVGRNCRSAFQDDGCQQRLLRLGERPRMRRRRKRSRRRSSPALSAHRRSARVAGGTAPGSVS